MSWIPKGWGEYPPEYNRAVHGPYNPSVFYGKRDTPFGDVKLGDLFSWLGRRRKSPRAVAQAISRGWFKYYLTWISVKKPGGSFLYHFFALSIIGGYLLDYQRYKQFRWYRYH